MDKGKSFITFEYDVSVIARSSGQANSSIDILQNKKTKQRRIFGHDLLLLIQHEKKQRLETRRNEITYDASNQIYIYIYIYIYIDER